MRLMQGIIQEERLVILMTVIHKLTCTIQEGLTKFFILPDCLFTAPHVADSADSIYDAHIMPL